jgi:hypothetical protein
MFYKYAAPTALVVFVRAVLTMTHSKNIRGYPPNPNQFDMTHSSANDIAALPPGGTLTTFDNGLTIFVRKSPSHGTVASRNHRVKMTL